MCIRDRPVITKDNVTMQIDTVVYYQITDPKLYTCLLYTSHERDGAQQHELRLHGHRALLREAFELSLIHI